MRSLLAISASNDAITRKAQLLMDRFGHGQMGSRPETSFSRRLFAHIHSQLSDCAVW